VLARLQAIGGNVVRPAEATARACRKGRVAVEIPHGRLTRVRDRRWVVGCDAMHRPCPRRRRDRVLSAVYDQDFVRRRSTLEWPLAATKSACSSHPYGWSSWRRARERYRIVATADECNGANVGGVFRRCSTRLPAAYAPRAHFDTASGPHASVHHADRGKAKRKGRSSSAATRPLCTVPPAARNEHGNQEESLARSVRGCVGAGGGRLTVSMRGQPIDTDWEDVVALHRSSDKHGDPRVAHSADAALMPRLASRAPALPTMRWRARFANRRGDLRSNAKNSGWTNFTHEGPDLVWTELSAHAAGNRRRSRSDTGCAKRKRFCGRRVTARSLASTWRVPCHPHARAVCDRPRL